MKYLVKNLSEQELEELANLTQHREWSYLTRLLDKVDDEAKNRALTFNTSDEAFKRQGYYEGIHTLIDLIRNLYGTTHSVSDIEQEGLDLGGSYDYEEG